MDKKTPLKALSRRGFLKGAAVAAGAVALTAAQAKAIPLKEAPKKWDLTTDVVVVGAGGAGMVAAVAAGEAGAKVTVLEKAPVAGGTTAISGAVIQAAGTKYQEKMGVKGDTTAAHYDYWYKSAESQADPKLVKLMAEQAPQNIKWMEAHGLGYVSVYGVPPIPNIDPKSMKPRIHVPAGKGQKALAGTGRSHMSVLYRAAKKHGVKIMLETRALALVYDSKAGIVGVKAEGEDGEFFIKAARGVVISSGGVDHNQEMARAFSPQQLWALDTGVCIAVPTNTGDGIKMAMSAGSDLAGMGGTIGLSSNAVGVGPLYAGMPLAPGIWVNKQGLRFVNEASQYAYAMRAVFQQEQHAAWAIFDEKVKKLGGKVLSGIWKPWSDDLKKEIAGGVVVRANTLKELGKKIGVNPDQLQRTLKVWNQDTAKGKDTLFHKTAALQPLADGPYYAAKISEYNLGSCGGIKINSKAQVIDVNGKPIRRLYAGGMAAGGFIGPYYPGSGTAIAATVCFGRIAGAGVAAEKSVR